MTNPGIAAKATIARLVAEVGAPVHTSQSKPRVTEYFECMACRDTGSLPTMYGAERRCACRGTYTKPLPIEDPWI